MMPTLIAATVTVCVWIGLISCVLWSDIHDSNAEKRTQERRRAYVDEGRLLRELPDEDVAWLADNGWVRATSEKLTRESDI